MAMVYRSSAPAQTRSGADGLVDIGQGPSHRRLQFQPLGQPGGDGRGQGTAGAAGMIGIQIGGGKDPLPVMGHQQILDGPAL